LHGLISRRSLLAASFASAVLAPAALAQQVQFDDGSGLAPGVDPDLLPPAESPIDYPIPEVNLRIIPEKFRRQEVEFTGPEEAGTIVVEPYRRFLFLVTGGGTAIRYGVGVGRAGFGWSGQAEVRIKRRWPRWVPPASMVARDEHARKWANGMPGGPDNPLGARALYLYSRSLYAGFSDTGYRIHGTNEPQSIGKAMSSGCIRMLDQDVAELFDRTPVGTHVVVRGSEPDEN
jgi:lipoprotein-anchoring transpeptidase ErfK/SrfK